MSNKFLGASDTNKNVSNGTIDLYGSTIGAVNLQPNYPVKTNSSNQLVSQKLFISDVDSLQSRLNAVLSNPYVGTLVVTDLETANYLSAEAEFKQIEHITNTGSAPDITTVSGSIVPGDLKTNTISDAGGNVFINLDTTDVNIQATALTFNSEPVLTTPLHTSVDVGQYNITNIDLLTTNRIQNVLNGNNIQLSTADIQISGNLDLNTNNIVDATNIEALTRTEASVAGELLKKVASTYYAGSSTLDRGMTNSIAIGSNIGLTTTGGDGSVIIGNDAVNDTISFDRSTAIGYKSQQGTLLTPVVGIRNSSVGYLSMANIGGISADNVALGANAIYKCDGCSGLTGIGCLSFSGGSATAISNSCCFGYNTRCAYSNSVALGYLATATKTNQCIIGNVNLSEIVPTASSTCNLGTSTNPFANLQISTINALTPQGGQWMAIGAGAIIANTTTETSFLGAMSSVGSLTSAANSFSVGSYALNISGSLESKNGDTLTVRFYAGLTGSTLFSSMVIPMTGTVSSSFEMETDFDIQIVGGLTVAQIAVNSECTYQDSGLSNLKGFRVSIVNNTTFSTTISNLLNITVQWSAADVLNSIQAVRGNLVKKY